MPLVLTSNRKRVAKQRAHGLQRGGRIPAGRTVSSGGAAQIFSIYNALDANTYARPGSLSNQAREPARYNVRTIDQPRNFWFGGGGAC